jgi:hypothetical protein
VPLFRRPGVCAMLTDGDMVSLIFFDIFLNIVSGQVSHQCSKSNPFRQSVDLSRSHCSKMLIKSESAMRLHC